MSFLRYFEQTNIVVWIIGLFFFHGALYYILGTPNWLFTTLIASGTWAIGLLVLRAVGRMMNKEKDPA